MAPASDLKFSEAGLVSLGQRPLGASNIFVCARQPERVSAARDARSILGPYSLRAQTKPLRQKAPLTPRAYTCRILKVRSGNS